MKERKAKSKNIGRIDRIKFCTNSVPFLYHHVKIYEGLLMYILMGK